MKASELIDFIITQNPQVLIKGIRSTLSAPEFLKDLQSNVYSGDESFGIIYSQNMVSNSKTYAFFVQQVSVNMLILAKYINNETPNERINPIPKAEDKWKKIKIAETFYYNLLKQFNSQSYRASKITLLNSSYNEVDFSTESPRLMSGLDCSFTFEIQEKIC